MSANHASFVLQLILGQKRLNKGGWCNTAEIACFNFDFKALSSLRGQDFVDGAHLHIKVNHS